MSIRVSLSIVLFKSTIALLIFRLDILFIVESGILKSPSIILLLSISPFSSVNIYFLYLGTLILSAYIFKIVVSTWSIIILAILSLPIHEHSLSLNLFKSPLIFYQISTHFSVYKSCTVKFFLDILLFLILYN